MTRGRPVVLDLFCGAGGAGMGWHQAGFDVLGVDLEPHDDYPFPFIQADALDVLADTRFARAFPLRHASPPCQAYSTGTRDHSRHPDLVGPVRELLLAVGGPYVMENVPQAPLLDPVRLCGSSFDLRVRRHRHFETNVPGVVGAPCNHAAQGQPVGVYGQHADGREYFRPNGTRRGNKARSVDDARDAMGIDWMTWDDLKEAIPPAYTLHLGRQILPTLDN